MVLMVLQMMQSVIAAVVESKTKKVKSKKPACMHDEASVRPFRRGIFVSWRSAQISARVTASEPNRTELLLHAVRGIVDVSIVVESKELQPLFKHFEWCLNQHG